MTEAAHIFPSMVGIMPTAVRFCNRHRRSVCCAALFLGPLMVFIDKAMNGNHVQRDEVTYLKRIESVGRIGLTPAKSLSLPLLFGRALKHYGFSAPNCNRHAFSCGSFCVPEFWTRFEGIELPVCDPLAVFIGLFSPNFRYDIAGKKILCFLAEIFVFGLLLAYRLPEYYLMGSAADGINIFVNGMICSFLSGNALCCLNCSPRLIMTVNGTAVIGVPGVAVNIASSLILSFRLEEIQFSTTKIWKSKKCLKTKFC